MGIGWKVDKIRIVMILMLFLLFEFDEDKFDGIDLTEEMFLLFEFDEFDENNV